MTTASGPRSPESRGSAVQCVEFLAKGKTAMPRSVVRSHQSSHSLGPSDGIDAFAGGIGFIAGTPSLWGFALVPAAWMCALTCGLGLLGFWGADWVSKTLFGDELGVWGQVGSW